MKIIIVGAGAVGSIVARRLSSENHDVTLIESEDPMASSAQQSLDAMILKGNGASVRVLREAGAEKADILIAVTNHDEINILSCVTAHRLGVPVKVARVRNEDYYVGSDSSESPMEEIDQMINPDREAVLEIHELLMKQAATDIYEFADGRVQIIGARVGAGAPVVDKSLIEIEREVGTRWALVAAITRSGKTIIPTGQDVILAEDQVFIVGREGKVNEALQYLTLPAPPVERVMIVGANHIGVSLAGQLGREGISVKLIEANPQLAQWASSRLDRCLVLLGEGTDQDLLLSEGVDEMGGFVAVSDEEEMNLAASLVARYHGARKTISLIKRPSYVPLSSIIGVDAAVSPRLSTARAIMRYFRQGNVLNLISLKENDAEIMELEASDNSPILGIPLRDLEFPRNALIGAIIKPYQVVIPRGGDLVEAGDQVLVFALPKAVRSVRKLF